MPVRLDVTGGVVRGNDGTIAFPHRDSCRCSQCTRLREERYALIKAGLPFDPKGRPIPMIPRSKFQTVLQDIADRDVETLVKKDAEYGSSWKKRGGVGAFMMLARKWDRLETQVTRAGLDSKYDVFDAIKQDAELHSFDRTGTTPPKPTPTESTLETIRDLRRYLLLVESEIMLRKAADNYQSQPQLTAPKLVKDCGVKLVEDCGVRVWQDEKPMCPNGHDALIVQPTTNAQQYRCQICNWKSFEFTL